MSNAATIEALPGEEWKGLVLDLLPPPGSWSEDAYLWLTDHTTRMVELNDGHLEVLPLPSDRHQSILQAIFLAFYSYLNPLGGKIQFAPLRLRLREGKIREPDLLLVKDAADPRRQNRFWTGADLVLEILSPDRPDRDRIEKRAEYAAAGIPEYWIVDPENEVITVLNLRTGSYQQSTAYTRGQVCASESLSGFSMPVDAAFDVM